MPPPIELQAEAAKLAPGLCGSALSLVMHKRRGFWASALYLVSGGIAARYLGPGLADFAHVSYSLAGFIAGLFGLAVISKVFEMIEFFDAREATTALLRKFGSAKAPESKL